MGTKVSRSDDKGLGRDVSESEMAVNREPKSSSYISQAESSHVPEL